MLTRYWLQIIINHGSHRHTAVDAGGVDAAVLQKERHTGYFLSPLPNSWETGPRHSK